MLSVTYKPFILSVIMLNVIMLSVVVPRIWHQEHGKTIITLSWSHISYKQASLLSRLAKMFIS
jgi:hypothetical protein